MNAPRIIPHEVLAVQRQASDPVGLGVGVGQCRLRQDPRAGATRDPAAAATAADPAKILCLTFTKAAAANMANRVFTTLAKWTTLDDAELDNAIREVGATRADVARRALARRLFARRWKRPAV